MIALAFTTLVVIAGLADHYLSPEQRRHRRLRRNRLELRQSLINRR